MKKAKLSVAIIGTGVKELEFETGENLGVIFSRSGISVSETQSIEVDGMTVGEDFVPPTGAIVTIVPNVGNG
ncbi:MAG: hypothetical protein LBQ02_00530 [Candidatus Nomurabacteria bacterium]|jgi:hypothetical protein|nr:hypothetical protein [Candidatus Nomurabacteria bacterium]